MKIGISHGDINSINYPLYVKAIFENGHSEQCTPILYGNSKVISYFQKWMEIYNVSFNISKSLQQINHKKHNILEIFEEDFSFEPGSPSHIGGKLAMISLRKAIEDVLEKKIDAIVTLPAHAETAKLYENTFKTNAQFIKQFTNSNYAFRVAVSEDIRLCSLASLEIESSLSLLTKENITKRILGFKEMLRSDFGIHSPKIAVLSLSKNFSEEYTSREDMEILEPIIQSCFLNHTVIFGPFIPESFFDDQGWKQYDGIICMYKEQIDWIFKKFSPEKLAYYTYGLPFIHVEPALNLTFPTPATKEISSTPLHTALNLASDLYFNRKEYLNLSKNPLGFENRTKERD